MNKEDDIFKGEIDESDLTYNEYTDPQVQLAIDEFGFDDDVKEQIKSMWALNMDYVLPILALSERIYLCAEQDVVSVPDISALRRQVDLYSQWTASVLKALSKDFTRKKLN